jgi:citrate lyase subunit beta/citryl-CoA lyase
LLDPARTIVRVNPAGTEEHAQDLAALADTPYDVIMLAKTEAAGQVVALGPRRVIALCETATGVLAATAIAACPQTVALMWGAEDLLAALGGRSSRYTDGRYRDVARHARSHVLLVAGAHAIPAIDAVHLDIGDLEGLRQEAADAAASGFAATACIHPTHVAVIRSAYRPTDDEIAWAGRVVAMAATAEGAFVMDGKMVDAPVLRHAHQILGQAGF